MSKSDFDDAHDEPTLLGWVGAAAASVRWLRATLIVSLLLVAAVPLVISDSYSVIEHTLSESGAQGVEGAWVFRLGVVLAACSVLMLTVTASSVWGPAGKWWLRVYGLTLIMATVFSEAPWDGGAYDETEATLHTVFGFLAGVSFLLGVVAVSTSRPRDGLVVRAFDWVVVAAVAVTPLIMMVVDRDGLLQRLFVVLGYLWLLVEATRIGQVTRHSQPASQAIHRTNTRT